MSDQPQTSRGASTARATAHPATVRPWLALVTYVLREDDVFDAAQRERLYAILDSADAPEVHEFLVADDVAAQPLYSPGAEPTLELVAPYVVPVNEELLTRLRADVWRDDWGLLVDARIPISSLVRHLRRLLLVDHPAGQTVYFRLYDPRVLRRFLPCCDAAELAHVFGPVDAYIVPDNSGDRFTRYVVVETRSAPAGGPGAASHHGLEHHPRLRLRPEHLAAFETTPGRQDDAST